MYLHMYGATGSLDVIIITDDINFYSFKIIQIITITITTIIKC